MHLRLVEYRSDGVRDVYDAAVVAADDEEEAVSCLEDEMLQLLVR